MGMLELRLNGRQMRIFPKVGVLVFKGKMKHLATWGCL